MRKTLTHLEAIRQRLACRFRPTPVVHALWVAGLIAAYMVIGGNSHGARFIAEERHQTKTSLAPYGAALHNTLQRYAVFFQSLVAFAVSQPDEACPAESFRTFAAHLYQAGGGICKLEIYPHNASPLIYPREIISSGLLEPPARYSTNQKEPVWELIVQKPSISATDALRQDRQELVAYQAVYRANEFWGFVVMRLDVLDLIQEAGLHDSSADMRWAITTPTGEVIFGDRSILQQNPIEIAINLPGLNWILEAVPTAGWNKSNGHQMQMFYVPIALVGFVTILIVYVQSRRFNLLQARLKEKASIVARELEEKSRVEQQLRREHALLDRIMDTTPVGVVMADVDDQVIFSNPAAKRLLGFDHLSQNLHNFTSEWRFTTLDGKPLMPAELPYSCAKKEKRPILGVRFIALRPGGQQVLLSSDCVPWIRDDGTYDGMVMVLQDISAELRASQALLESEERYRCLVDLSPDLVFVEVEGRFSFINPAGVRLFGGESIADFIGLPVAERISTGCSAVSVSQRWGTGEEDPGAHLREQIFLRLNGSPVPMEVAAAPLALQGKFGMLVVARDITERKRTEEALHLRIEEIARRNAEFQALADVAACLRLADTRAQFVPLLLEQSMHLMGAPNGALALFENGKLHVWAAAGSLACLQGQSLAPGQGGLWCMLHRDHSGFLECTACHEKREPCPLSTFFASSKTTCVIAPLESGSDLIGLLLVNRPTSQSFHDQQRHILAGIIDMAENALRRLSAVEALEQLVDGRTRDLDAIYQVSAAANQAKTHTQALRLALERVIQTVSAPMGAIFLPDGDGDRIRLAAEIGLPPDVKSQLQCQPASESLAFTVFNSGKPLVLLDLSSTVPGSWLAQLPQVYAYFGLPMRVHERTVGVLAVITAVEKRLKPEQVTLISFMADHLALMMDNHLLRFQAEKNAVQEERSRLARDLHDSVTQSLYAASLYAGGGLKLLEQGDLDQIQTYLKCLQQVIQQALKEMRLMVFELRSPMLNTHGLSGALQYRLDAVERRSGVRVDLKVDTLPFLPAMVEENLYRIANEALNNALKHACADRLLVQLKVSGTALTLKVSDDGQGFDVRSSATGGGLGIRSMRERTVQMGGQLDISTSPGEGTIVSVSVDLAENYTKGDWGE